MNSGMAILRLEHNVTNHDVTADRLGPESRQEII